MNNAPLRYDRSFHLRTDDEFRRRLDVVRTHEVDVPPAADMIRRLVDRAYMAIPGKTKKRA